jgi:hypothetical protein
VSQGDSQRPLPQVVAGMPTKPLLELEREGEGVCVILDVVDNEKDEVCELKAELVAVPLLVDDIEGLAVGDRLVVRDAVAVLLGCVEMEGDCDTRDRVGDMLGEAVFETLNVPDGDRLCDVDSVDVWLPVGETDIGALAEGLTSVETDDVNDVETSDDTLLELVGSVLVTTELDGLTAFERVKLGDGVSVAEAGTVVDIDAVSDLGADV